MYEHKRKSIIFFLELMKMMYVKHASLLPNEELMHFFYSKVVFYQYTQIIGYAN